MRAHGQRTVDQFMGELTAQVGISESSNCKNWYENERVCGMTQLINATNSRVFVPGFAVLFFGRLGNPNLSGYSSPMKW